MGNLESMLETADRKMRESLLLAEKAKREVGESKAQAKQARRQPHVRSKLHARPPGLSQEGPTEPCSVLTALATIACGLYLRSCARGRSSFRKR